MKIKTRNIADKTIKSLDKAVVGTQKLKDNILNIKEKMNNIGNKDENIQEGANREILGTSNKGVNDTIYNINKYGKKSAINTKDKVNLLKSKLKSYNQSKLIKNNKVISRTVKTPIKTFNQTAKNIKTTMKTSQKALMIAKRTVKNTINIVKNVSKATIKAIKGIIAGTKALVSALIAGGWIALIIIIIVSMIGLLCSSTFGIFLSNEKPDKNGNSMSKVVQEINNDVSNKISEIRRNNSHDDYVIVSNKAQWKDVLSIYTIKTSSENNTDVITINSDKINMLKTVFWDMNTITSSIKEEPVNEERIDENGNSTIASVSKKVLYINISSKTVDEMVTKYNFNDNQKKNLIELQSERYSNLWSSVIYGTSVGSLDIVNVAISQLGNIGGEPYWKWYGYSYRVEWCAIFVSYVANEAGYIERGIVPKFASCNTQGVVWFKTVGLWRDKGFMPNAGDIIFFDWEQDGLSDHVGIVEKVVDGKVYTIEGNSNNECKRNEYSITSNVIYGYGVPSY